MARDMVQVRRPSGAMQYGAPKMSLGRSQFDLTHSHKTMFDAGSLIPYLVLEVLPGDTVTAKLLAFARIWSPLDAPVMDNIEMSIDYFYAPNRILWDNWYAFLGAHDDAGAQDTDFTIPVVSTGTAAAAGSLMNYMGIPIGLVPNTTEVNALPFRMYHTIYNTYYRDQNLIDQVDVTKGNGPDNYSGHLTLRKSAKKHDYFTSALPYLQKGDPVTIDLTGDAPIRGIGIDTSDTFTTGSITVRETDGASGPYTTFEATSATNEIYIEGTNNPDARPQIYAQLSGITSVSINALREAAAIQRLLERDARGGTRPREAIRSHWGVDVPDYRVQEPEYLGGGRGYINVSAVANTSATASEDQGQLVGVGTGTLTGGFAKSFVEHGYIIGILRARADVTYQQGLERHWSRSTKYDYPYPELAHLGEQAILNKELYVQGLSADDDTWAYQERYAEMRYKKSLVTGKLASDATGSLDFWHLAEDFGSLPAFNQTFIEDASPMSRVTTVDSEPDFIIDGRFDIKVARALPVRPVPSLTPARF